MLVNITRNNTSCYTMLSWTANKREIDGYIIYLNTSTGLAITSNVGNVTEVKLQSLVPLLNYTVAVRAYQDLLGPSSTVLAFEGMYTYLYI